MGKMDSRGGSRAREWAGPRREEDAPSWCAGGPVEVPPKAVKGGSPWVLLSPGARGDATDPWTPESVGRFRGDGNLKREVVEERGTHGSLHDGVRIRVHRVTTRQDDDDSVGSVGIGMVEAGASAARASELFMTTSRRKGRNAGRFSRTRWMRSWSSWKVGWRASLSSSS